MIMEMTCMKTKEKKYLLLGAVVTVLLLYGVDCVPEYATDTYNTLINGAWQHMFFDNGRVISGLVYYVIENWLHLSFDGVYILSYFTGIIFSIASVYIFAGLIKCHGIDVMHSTLISTLCILNFFSIEYYLFLETGLFMIAIFAVSFAVKCTVEFFIEKKISKLICTLVLLLVAVFIYQAILGLYVILLFPFVIKYSDTLMDFGKNNMIIALEYALAMGTGLLVTHTILNSQRVGENVSSENGSMQLLFSKFAEVLITDKYFPIGIRLALLSIAIVLIIGVMFVTLRAGKIKDILLFFYIIIGTVIVAFLPQLLGTTIDFAMRIVYPSASIVGILILHVLINYDLRRGKSIHFNDIISTFLIVLVIAEMLFFTSVFVDRYKVNQADKLICQSIVYEINKYEKESGHQVTKVCFYEDAKAGKSYDGIDSSRLIYKSFDKEWSDLCSLNYFAGRDFVRGEFSPEHDGFFKSQDWNAYSSEQLIFDEDTLHVCRF